MEFEKYFYKMIQELNQSTINSALMKHQSIKDKNPVAKHRAGEFSQRAKRQGEKRGLLIRTRRNPESRRTSDYANYYIESANSEYYGERIIMKALMVDPFEDHKSEPADLVYFTEENQLYVKGAGGGDSQLWLESRTDAQNLARTIKKYTGVDVSWKNMDFISSGDYSNQYDGTRYDMSKLGK